MKAFLLALLATSPAFANPAADTRSACNPAEVLAAVNQTAPDAYRPGAKASVRYAGYAAPGETRNVMVLVDDFNVKNTYGVNAEIFVIVGRSLASETTAWIAVADQSTCELRDAWEALHTGGGGL